VTERSKLVPVTVHLRPLEARLLRRLASSQGYYGPPAVVLRNIVHAQAVNTLSDLLEDDPEPFGLVGPLLTGRVVRRADGH
jgi:hypothetical protein